jgi:hypothetical protein
VESLAFTQQTEALLAYVQSAIAPGDQIMFVMDVPEMLTQTAPIVYEQAANASSQIQAVNNQKPKFVIYDCQQVESGSDTDSAERSMDPAGMLRILMAEKTKPIDENAVKVQVLVQPKHGKLREEIANTGYHFFAYDPNPGYLGKDTVVFQAEANGILYRIISTLVVVRLADERPDQTVCPAPYVDIFGRTSGLTNPTNYTFSSSDLSGAAVAQTTGVGQYVSITLDTDAAGHDWFVDATPDQNEEFLPTADATIWQAKPDSEAAGKMDMLSVLLHEYGHALTPLLLPRH